MTRIYFVKLVKIGENKSPPPPPAKSYKSEYKWYISKYLFIYFIIDPNIVWAWIMLSNVHCFSQEWLEIV